MAAAGALALARWFDGSPCDIYKNFYRSLTTKFWPILEFLRNGKRNDLWKASMSKMTICSSVLMLEAGSLTIRASEVSSGE